MYLSCRSGRHAAHDGVGCNERFGSESTKGESGDGRLHGVEMFVDCTAEMDVDVRSGRVRKLMHESCRVEEACLEGLGGDDGGVPCF